VASPQKVRRINHFYVEKMDTRFYVMRLCCNGIGQAYPFAISLEPFASLKMAMIRLSEIINHIFHQIQLYRTL